MSTKNDITGDKIQSGVPSQEYLNNYDAIFRKPKKETNEVLHTESTTHTDLQDNR